MFHTHCIRTCRFIPTDSNSLSGCSEMLMAKVVTDLANRTPGKEAVAMESFAKALRMV